MSKNNKTVLSRRKSSLLVKQIWESKIYLALSFIIPFLVIWFFFKQNEVHPFGTKQILVTDLWHQYYPFFRVEHEKLQSMSSFLYSWDTGLGTNFISLMSYYAASPLNFLAVFFPIEYSRDALTLFLTLKIGCAGLFFAVFLKHTFNKNDFSITAFAVCYALCDFIMGYYWNIIWIDTVALLPLVVLGTVKLYKEGKYKLYVISLALSLMTSFYIGLFTCIFTVMVFAGLIIAEWGGFKNAFKRLGQIIGATAIGIGIGAVILLPAFLALLLTHSVNNQFPQDMIFYETWPKMISAVTGFHEPTAKEGLPNFYCGMAAVALLGMYIVTPKVKIREKIITCLYLAFIVVSCNMNILNYMWHGFHFTNMLPYRFSFLLSFILLTAAYRAFSAFREYSGESDISEVIIKILEIAAMGFITVGVGLITYKNQPKKALISSMIVCGIVIALMLVFWLVQLFSEIYGKKSENRKKRADTVKKFSEKALNFMIFAVCFVEMGINARIGVETVTVTDYLNYPVKRGAITDLLEELESKDDGFYRVEKISNYSINDPALYGYRGVSQFSSTANVNVTNLMHELGIDASDAGNRYYYNQNTAVLNSFLNLKYLMATDSYSGDLTYLEPLAKEDVVTVYENNHYLPIGFTAENSLFDYTGRLTNPFENQNELFKCATGIDKDVLKRLDMDYIGYKGLNVTPTGYGNYNFQSDNSDDSSRSYMRFKYIPIYDGPIYAVCNFTDVSGVTVNQHYYSNLDKYLRIFAAGDFKAGEEVSFEVKIDEDKSGSGSIYVYQIDPEIFEEGYKNLSAGGLEVKDFGDTYINGTIKAENDCIMYTSIPYDGGWTAYVDGKKTEVKSLKNAFVCVPLTEGEHEIKLKYSPPGFFAGVCITVVSLAVFILIWVFEPKIVKSFEKRRKAKVPEITEQPEKTIEEDEES